VSISCFIVGSVPPMDARDEIMEATPRGVAPPEIQGGPNPHRPRGHEVPPSSSVGHRAREFRCRSAPACATAMNCWGLSSLPTPIPQPTCGGLNSPPHFFENDEKPSARETMLRFVHDANRAVRYNAPCFILPMAPI